MKRLILAITVFFGIVSLYAQSYDQERTALKNFLVRMYKAEPFEGIKVVSTMTTTICFQSFLWLIMVSLRSQGIV